MKRLIQAAMAVVSIATVAVVAAPPVQAGPLVLHTFSGVLSDTQSGKPIAGAAIVALDVNGFIAAKLKTGLGGAFSVQSENETLGFRVVSAPDHQAGYRLCEFATAWTPGPPCQLGFADPILIDTLRNFVAGDVLDSLTGAPLPGVTVTAVDPFDGITPFGQALTDANGHYVVRGVVGDEVGIFVNGVAVGHRAGYFSCLKTLVRTWAEACTYAPGFRMTHVIAPILTVPRNVVLGSRTGAVAVSLLRPLAGTPNGYDLRCIDPDGAVNVLHFLASGAKVGPLVAGVHKCRVRATSVWGPGPYSLPQLVTVF